VQIGGREPDSAEEEVLLMTEVDSLQSQLREKGKTFNERIENVFMDGLLGQPTTVRIRRWTIRRDQLRKMAEAPHATSGGPAVSLDDTGTSLKADQHVEKAEEKQTKGAKRHGLKNGGEQPRKRHKTPRKYTYHTREDGQPPEMSQIHVDFARLSCAYISAPAAAGAAGAGSPGGGDARPCAEGAVDPRSAAAAAWREGHRSGKDR
jgi:hypothetical protein